MTDDLVKRLREDVEEFDGTCGKLANLAANRIEELERELEEEGHYREIAATKAWGFAGRIKELEAVLLEIANAVGDPSAYWIARTALEKKNVD